MNETLFDYAPTVQLLQELLGNGSYLHNSFQKAVRLWVILRSLYGDVASDQTVRLDHSFSVSAWSQQFFTNTQDYHYDRDKATPIHHDPECPCAKTAADWLFDPYYGIDPQQWKCEFAKEYAIADPKKVEQILLYGSFPKKRPLIEGRLFVVTGKTLLKDFNSLLERGWLEEAPNLTGKKGKEYQKVTTFPKLLSIEKPDAITLSNFISIEDIVSLAENLGQKINGVQRFFLDVEYIVLRQLSDRIEELQQQLKSSWESADIPPIQINYTSARLFNAQLDLIVYPVCIRYHQRAPYLYAYGQAPHESLSPSDIPPLDWYDYRLDHIDSITTLSWSDHQIPIALKQKRDRGTLPTIDDVNAEMGRALGFDFFRPKQTMLLRFNQYFHGNYIERTERTALFKTISYDAAERLLKNTSANTPEQNEKLLKILRTRPHKDVYCRVEYYVGDRTAIMRLRAWGQQVEVLSPWDLRQQMREDINRLWKIYDK
jgi:CRISPR-associated protein (TIGR03985 family)